ncbi:MAG: phosphotransferase [Anaerolineae bacterium]|nr:phosphotransferase [Anaerolineae bacterium]
MSIPHLTSRLAVLAILTFAGLICIAYNLYLLTNTDITFGSRFSYFALGVVMIVLGPYIYQLQKITSPDQQSLPRISTIDDPNVVPQLNSEQLYILQQLFQNDYRIRIRSLAGGFSNFGVFQVIREISEDRMIKPGVVVKFLSYRDIQKEKTVHQDGGVLKRYPLAFIPGEPIDNWPPDYKLGDTNRIGAISYKLTALRLDSKLQTLKSMYKDSSADDFTSYLTLLFERLDRWYAFRLPQSEGISLGGPEGLYERLYRRRTDILRGIIQLIGTSSLSTTSVLSVDELDRSATLQLPFLPDNWSENHFVNPNYWIKNVLVPNQAQYFRATSPLSPVHGDLHTGNVLIERGLDTNIWLIDFPNAHIGPSLQDFVTMEADIKFNLIDMNQCSIEEWFEFEHQLLVPLINRRSLTLTSPWSQDWKPKGELLKAWQLIGFLREWVVEHNLIGADIRAYYLALLHATLPTIYRATHTNAHKQYALTSSARICEYLTD